MEEYVLDTSALVAAILGARIYESLMKCRGKYYVASYVLDELIRRSEKIASRIAERSGGNILEITRSLIVKLTSLYRRLTLVDQDEIVDEKDIEEARKIIAHRDPKDVPIMALAIALRKRSKRPCIISLDDDFLEEGPKHGIEVLKRPRCCHSSIHDL